MSQKTLFDKVSIRTSRMTTRAYSTSFSLGIRCLDKRFRDPIYAIYGFVRFADEIVDTFHEYNKKELLDRFRRDTWLAIDEGISLNPILNSFQTVVRTYNIDREVIEQFLHSMEMDLTMQEHDTASYAHYILGSAEVVGLMCLRIFVEGDSTRYEQLKPSAMKLGSAFQKINFLRDLQADTKQLGRTYFPELKQNELDEATKRRIEDDIAADFDAGFLGIKQLPKSARLGVYVAYYYYKSLFNKIKSLPCDRIATTRVRIRNRYKIAILGYCYVRHSLNLI